MALAWFIAPYKRDLAAHRPTRHCSVDDVASQIAADAGAYEYAEILGNVALVKVRASTTTLATVAGLPGVLQIPLHWDLNDTLSDLTTIQQTAITGALLALGYQQAELDAVLPTSWASVTLRQLLQLAATRRLEPRYDQPSNTIFVDGPVQPVRSIDDVTDRVQ